LKTARSKTDSSGDATSPDRRERSKRPHTEGAQMPSRENPIRPVWSGTPLERPGARTRRAAMGILAAVLSLSMLAVGVDATAAATGHQAGKKPKVSPSKQKVAR
jgi:hypothetical protein